MQKMTFIFLVNEKANYVFFFPYLPFCYLCNYVYVNIVINGSVTKKIYRTTSAFCTTRRKQMMEYFVFAER